MKILVQYDYPASPGGLATQGDLLYRGLLEIGVDARAVNSENAQEKEWYYQWFKPDAVVGIGYWGHTPGLVLHPERFGMRAVPWLVADGYVLNYREALEKVPLMLVTSDWVGEVYERDGIHNPNTRTLPVGCDTDTFRPIDQNDDRVGSIRKSMGVADDELMLLTVGGDAASKGGREAMQALAQLKDDVPKWKYVFKVWPQPRTETQTREDIQLAADLGIADRVTFVTNRASRDFMPYLLNACDLYVGPSRLEGFGMPQVEAGACGKPVTSINAMSPKETLLHGETALLADVAELISVTEAFVGPESGFPVGHRVTFDRPRVADYRASVPQLAEHFQTLMTDPELRLRMGAAGRDRVAACFDYRLVARTCLDLLRRHLEIKEPNTVSNEPTLHDETAA